MPGICLEGAESDDRGPERWRGQPAPERSGRRVPCPSESRSSSRRSRLAPLAGPGEEMSGSPEELEAWALGEQG